MSIAAIGGVSHHAAFAPVGATRRPESAEAPGAPDHDGDSDDAAAKAGSGQLTVGRRARLRPKLGVGGPHFGVGRRLG